MNYRELVKYVREIIKLHPNLEDEIIGLLELCEMEIELGESESHEVALCYKDIQELLESGEES